MSSAKSKTSPATCPAGFRHRFYANRCMNCGGDEFTIRAAQSASNASKAAARKRADRANAKAMRSNGPATAFVYRRLTDEYQLEFFQKEHEKRMKRAALILQGET